MLRASVVRCGLQAQVVNLRAEQALQLEQLTGQEQQKLTALEVGVPVARTTLPVPPTLVQQPAY